MVWENLPDNVDCKLIWKARTGKWRISSWIKKAWPDNVDRGLIWKRVAVAYAVAYAAHDSQPDWLWTRLLIVGYTSVQIRVHQYTSVQISIHQYTSVSISTHQYTIAHNSGPMRGICHMRTGICHMRRYVAQHLIFAAGAYAAYVICGCHMRHICRHMSYAPRVVAEPKSCWTQVLTTTG